MHADVHRWGTLRVACSDITDALATSNSISTRAGFGIIELSIMKDRITRDWSELFETRGRLERPYEGDRNLRWIFKTSKNSHLEPHRIVGHSASSAQSVVACFLMSTVGYTAIPSKWTQN